MLAVRPPDVSFSRLVWVNSVPTASSNVGMAPAVSTRSSPYRSPWKSRASVRVMPRTWNRSADWVIRKSGLRWKLSATTASSVTVRGSQCVWNRSPAASTASPSFDPDQNAVSSARAWNFRRIDWTWAAGCLARSRSSAVWTSFR